MPRRLALRGLGDVDLGAGLDATSATVVTAPWIAAYDPDGSKAGSPGFWPTNVATGRGCTTICYVDGSTGSDANSGSATANARARGRFEAPDRGSSWDRSAHARRN